MNTPVINIEAEIHKACVPFITKRNQGYFMEKVREIIQSHGIAPPDGVDWKALYRFQSAMRFMDNMPSLSKENAYKMADADVASLIASSSKAKP